MSYTRSASAQKLVDNAHTKLLLYFLDGNVRTQYGRHDFNSNCPAKNPRAVELRRHERSVAKNKDFIKVALIYDLSMGRKSAASKGGWV